MEYLEAVEDSKVLKKVESEHFYHINEVDMNLTVCNFSDIFPNGQVSEIEPSDLKYVNFIVHYDGTKEEFGLTYNREEMINLYKLFDSFTEEDLKNDEATFTKKALKWTSYLDKLYYFDSERYLQEVENYIKIISKTDYKEVYNDAYTIFFSKKRTFKLLDKEYVQRIYTNFSNLYYGKDSLLEKDRKSRTYEILIGLYDALDIRDNEKFNRIVKEGAWDYPMDEFLQPEK